MIEAPAPGDPAGGGPAGGVPTGGGGSRAVQRSAARARRPAIVTILALLQLHTAAGYWVIVVGLLVDSSTTMPLLIGEYASPGAPATTAQAVAAATVMIGGFGVAALAAGILLLRMRQLGWTLTMLLTGLGLVSSISIWWTQGTTIPIWLFVQVMTVFYLNQRQVREAFGISRRDAGDALSAAGETAAEARR